MDASIFRKFRKLRSILNKLKNLSTAFHLLIIAMFILSINGCGYKSAPSYEEEVPVGDENVKFIKKEPSK